MQASFFAYYAGIARRPGATFRALAGDPRRVRLGTLAVLSNAALYTVVYVFLVLAHGRPTVFHPWLAIDAEVYYRWDVFLCGPSVVVAWLLAGAIVQLAARTLGGRGTFEDTLSVLGYAIALASWCTLGHDLFTGALGAVRVIDQRAYEDAMSSAGPAHTLIWALMLAYLGAFLVLFAKAVAAAQGIQGARAIALGVLGFVAYQGVFVLFNR